MANRAWTNCIRLTPAATVNSSQKAPIEDIYSDQYTCAGANSSERSNRIALSVDVEEWFHTYAARKWYPQSTWDFIPGRIFDTMDETLKLLDEHNARATFFFLGWLAERHPELLLRVHSFGHEIGYHGYSHTVMESVVEDQFKEHLDRFIMLNLSLSLPPPVGFRAPGFSLSSRCSWLISALAERGFKYDSSIYPDFRNRYGIVNAPADPFFLSDKQSTLLELPLATIDLAGVRIPAAGGAYLRFYPGCLHRTLLRMIQRDSRVPILYFHPWEIDIANTSKRMSSIQRFRQHHNTGINTVNKMQRLLSSYESVALANLYQDIDPALCSKYLIS